MPPAGTIEEDNDSRKRKAKENGNKKKQFDPEFKQNAVNDRFNTSRTKVVKNVLKI